MLSAIPLYEPVMSLSPEGLESQAFELLFCKYITFPVEVELYFCELKSLLSDGL